MSLFEHMMLFYQYLTHKNYEKLTKKESDVLHSQVMKTGLTPQCSNLWEFASV